VQIPLSFLIPLKAEESVTGTPVIGEQNVHFIEKEKTAKAGEGCGEGSAAKPEAEAGNLCIYVGRLEGIDLATEVSAMDPGLSGLPNGAGATGFVLQVLIPEGLAGAKEFGTWAVSAK
jgi:hypothetical protein